MKTYFTFLLVLFISFGFAQNEKTLQLVSTTPDIDTCENIPINLIANFIDADSLQWQKYNGINFVSISDNATYSGTNNDTLSFITSIALNNSTFRCVAYNMGDSIFSDDVNISIENLYPTLTNNLFQNICFRDSVELSVVNANTILWSTGQTQSTIYVQSDTTKYYYINASNSLNCMLYDSVLVDVNYLSANLIVQDTVCQNNEFDAIVNISGQYTNRYWNFNGENGWSYNDTVYFTCKDTGYHSISCFVFNNTNNCSSDTIEKNIYSLSNTVEIHCFNDTLITIDNANSFQWLYNNNILPGENNNYLAVETMGIYNLFSINGNNGCSSQTSYFYKNNMVDTILVNPDTICEGDSALLSFKKSNCKLIDFNNLELDILTSNTTPFFDNPCMESIDNSAYLWVGNDNCFARDLTTEVLDITDSVEICFDFIMGYQGLVQPCDGPDELGEGVSLQYSIDTGITWQTITYFCPNGEEYPVNQWNGEVLSAFTGFKTKFNEWGTYCYEIYTQVPQIRIRWIQESYTPYGEACKVNYDQWGLDNIYICGLADSLISIQWYNDSNFISNYNDIHVSPNATTEYTLYINNYIDTINGIVFVNPLPQPEIYSDTSNIISTNIYEQYQWYMNDSNILGATDFEYEIDTSAFYSVEVTDTNGCVGNSDTTYFVFTSINHIDNDILIKLYPNPAKDFLIIENKNLVLSKIEIFDFSGKVLIRKENNSNRVKIDISELENGVYFININDVYKNIKFIKQ